MKVLLGYAHGNGPVDMGAITNSWLQRLRDAGLHVDGFCLTLDPPGPYLTWPELDKYYKLGNRKLLTMYENLAMKLEAYDVLLNFNGINLHPRFVERLNTFVAYACFDDPESSQWLSKPVAPAYDLCLVGNVAEVETYRQWGVKNAVFWPLGFRQGDCDKSVTLESILNGQRTNDIVLLCEREMHNRRNRLDEYVHAFPNGVYRGKGWPAGFLPENKRAGLYAKSKIGPNFHNSTGPINFRTYALPANGILQICDNKAHLGAIYKLDKEVLGFDDIKEAIELTKYYLAHDRERREIAAAGWTRAHKDYNEVAVFQRAIDTITALCVSDSRDNRGAIIEIQELRSKTKYSHHILNASIAAKKMKMGIVVPTLRKIRSKLRGRKEP